MARRFATSHNLYYTNLLFYDQIKTYPAVLKSIKSKELENQVKIDICSDSNDSDSLIELQQSGQSNIKLHVVG